MNAHPSRRPLPFISTTALLSFLVAMLFSTQAMALDGYKDRRGFFGGLSVGGGVGLVESE